MRKVLFVTYFWPPSGKATVHWPLRMIQHLSTFGWQPCVLTAASDTFSEKDESLLRGIAPDLQVYKVRAFEPFNLYRAFVGKNKLEPLVAAETISKLNRGFRHRFAIWIRMNLLIPDARIGWYWNAVRQGKRIVQSEGVSAIVSIGPPHTTLLVGRKLSKVTGIPHIPVFIDPWVDIAYYRGFKRNKLTTYLDRRLERLVLEQASRVVFVTQSMREDFKRRYPEIGKKSTVLYWGFDEEAFRNFKQRVTQGPEILLHAGNIFDFQNPKLLWPTIRKEIDQGRNLAVVFIGTVGPGIRQSIEEAGLQEHTAYMGFLPYEKMIEELSLASYLLVCATEKRHVPGKLFEYLRSGKPILAFGDDNKEVENILKRLQAGLLLPYSSDASEFFRIAKSFQPDSSAARAYDRRNIAGDLAAILSSLSNRKQ